MYSAVPPPQSLIHSEESNNSSFPSTSPKTKIALDLTHSKHKLASQKLQELKKRSDRISKSLRAEKDKEQKYLLKRDLLQRCNIYLLGFNYSIYCFVVCIFYCAFSNFYLFLKWLDDFRMSIMCELSIIKVVQSEAHHHHHHHKPTLTAVLILLTITTITK